MQDRKAYLSGALEFVRRKTLSLLDLVPEEFLKVRVHSFYSPIGWHFGHIGRTEEYWISHKALGRPVIDDHLSFLFADLPENPKDNRVNLPSRELILQYLSDTRERTLADLATANLDPESPFLDNGYAWDFALQHECQHQETICEMLQLIHLQQPSGDFPELGPWPSPRDEDFATVPGGRFTMGTADICVYDNEQGPHEVEVARFKLAIKPVTVNQWRRFMESGGYARAELWSPEGWAWRCTEDVTAPEYWRKKGDAYFIIGCQGPRAMHPEEPVTSISWFEAEAYLKWTGKRFPTESEWEYAASRSEPDDNRRFPWGSEPPNQTTAIFGMNTLHPEPAGSRPCGASLDGVLDLSGNTWEWTATSFAPYPGFQAFPYDGYSKDHMQGHHKVCRGGSWATSGPLLRRTFRNWYVPTYRQGFLGLRCADD
jgi:iron(II)-dependent oxidoreductase